MNDVAHVDVPLHTEEQLRAAWAKCRTKLWPDTFEETMKDPLRARVVDVVASGMAKKRPVVAPPATLDRPTCRIHQSNCDEVRASRRCANCTLRPPPRMPHFQPPPGYVDRKRAAAGEREDD
jgi:hypothetical protein